ncbi:MAG TPA: hypothetical protein PKA64_02245 [Myxococcota bacterium]|nr:hypothetical protein [Myxococcota bacterium]
MFALLCALGGAARADDVLLVPEMSASVEIDPMWASDVQTVVLQTLRDNGFVVIDAATTRRVAGDVLDRCAPADRAPCTLAALMSVPARVAIQLELTARPEGGNDLGAVFFLEGQPDPISQISLPIELGKERRLALQIAMFSLDVVNDAGPASAGIVQAARALVASGRPVPQGSTEIRVYGGSDEDLPPPPRNPPPPEEDLLDDDPGEDLSDPESIDEEVEDPIEPREPDLLPRYVAGSKHAYEARKEGPKAWYAKRTPHAGRVLIELRGGFAHSDVNRAAYSLATTGADRAVTSTLYKETATPGVAAHVDGFLGYAPATMIDFGVAVGADIARDTVVVGLMREGQDPEFGDPKRFAIGRPTLQPRVRAWLVQLGPVKPYLAAGVQFTFVAQWSFDVEDNAPLPRPPGGLLYSVVGGLGVALDPHPRVGIVLGGDFLYHLGDLSRVRMGYSAGGGLVGNDFPVPKAARFSIVPTLGLQFRL